MDARCSATNKNGSPCSAGPVRDDGYCYWHSPDLAGQRLVDRQRGGAARSNKERARKRIAATVLSPGDLEGLLGDALRSVLSGQLEPGVGTAAASIARTLIAVREATEVEQRLTALEMADRHANGRRSG